MGRIRRSDAIAISGCRIVAQEKAARTERQGRERFCPPRVVEDERRCRSVSDHLERDEAFFGNFSTIGLKTIQSKAATSE